MGAKRKAKKAFAEEQELAKLRAVEERKQAAKSAATRRKAEAANKATALRQEKLDAMTPAEQTQFKKSENRAKVGILFVALCLLGGCIYLGSQSGGSDGSDDSPAASQDDGSDEPDVDQEVMEVSAFEVCKDFVKDRLKSPGSATFRNQFEDDGEVVVTGSGRGPYTIVSTVDSDNSFGASIRNTFTCTVTNTGDDMWSLKDINIAQR